MKMEPAHGYGIQHRNLLSIGCPFSNQTIAASGTAKGWQQKVTDSPSVTLTLCGRFSVLLNFGVSVYINNTIIKMSPYSCLYNKLPFIQKRTISSRILNIVFASSLSDLFLWFIDRSQYCHSLVSVRPAWLVWLSASLNFLETLLTGLVPSSLTILLLWSFGKKELLYKPQTRVTEVNKMVNAIIIINTEIIKHWQQNSKQKNNSGQAYNNNYGNDNNSRPNNRVVVTAAFSFDRPHLFGQTKEDAYNRSKRSVYRKRSQSKKTPLLACSVQLAHSTQVKLG